MGRRLAMRSGSAARSRATSCGDARGRHPDTGQPLGRGFGDKSARGFDATFSAPKSVSVLWALSPDPWVRAEVLAAHDTAVTAALGWLERHGAVTRRGTDGVDQVDTQGLVAAAVPPAHQPQRRSAAAHPRRDLVQGPGPHRPVALPRRPVPQVPAALDRLGLRRRAAQPSSRPGSGVGWDPVPAKPATPTSPASAGAARGCSPSARRRSRPSSPSTSGRWTDEHDGAEPDPRTIARLQRWAVIDQPPGQGPRRDADDAASRVDEPGPPDAGVRRSARSDVRAGPVAGPLDRETIATR